MANFTTHIVVGTIVSGSLATLDAGRRYDRAGEPCRRHHGGIAGLGAARHRLEGFAPEPCAVRGACDLLLVRRAVPLCAPPVDRRDVAVVGGDALVRALRAAYGLSQVRGASRHLALHIGGHRVLARHGHRILLRAGPSRRRRLACCGLSVHRLSDASDPRRDLLGRCHGRAYQEVVRNRPEIHRYAPSRGDERHAGRWCAVVAHRPLDPYLRRRNLFAQSVGGAAAAPRAGRQLVRRIHGARAACGGSAGGFGAGHGLDSGACRQATPAQKPAP